MYLDIETEIVVTTKRAFPLIGEELFILGGITTKFLIIFFKKSFLQGVAQ